MDPIQMYFKVVIETAISDHLCWFKQISNTCNFLLIISNSKSLSLVVMYDSLK